MSIDDFALLFCVGSLLIVASLDWSGWMFIKILDKIKRRR